MRRGLARSRERAAELIAAGRVTVSGAPALKAARLVADHEPVEVLGPPARYVGRGGEKLEAALGRFALDVSGRRALDAGSSTGGFTDCLLQHGASEVVAVDVGHGQLDATLRGDQRVRLLERRDIRSLDPADVGGEVDVVTGDLSFISLASVARPLVELCAPGGDLVVLVKPQFEVGRAAASRGRGVIRDPRLWRGALERVVESLGAAGAPVRDATVSPLRGAAGNVEFFVAASRGAGTTRPVPEMIAEAVCEAEGLVAR